MTTHPIIEIDNLSKLYRLGSIGYGSLRESVGHWWAGRRKRPLPGHAAGIHPDQVGPRPNTFWALKDFSATIREGEILGIIGRNGAGKSTLLKLLSRITEPTRGRALVHGRVGSMLEVGAGFHAELSGRDNIFLNGAILGMKKAEISRRLDEIIEFADIGGFIDTPVKRYSSGMYVRLAFAVTAHLEPDILLVDEVLAVGDAGFQRRCLGRMKDISSEHGRTVLFVSHNLEAVQRLCSVCILLDRGRLKRIGSTRSIVSEYLADGAASSVAGRWTDVSEAPRDGTGEARFAAARITSGNADAADRPYSNGPLEIELAIDAKTLTRVQSIAIGLRDETGRRLVNADLGSFGETITLPEGRTIIRMRIEQLHLRPGKYGLALWMARYPGEHISGGDIFDFVEKAMDVEVVDLSPRGVRTSLGDTGLVTCDFRMLDISHPWSLRDTLTTAVN